MCFLFFSLELFAKSDSGQKYVYSTDFRKTMKKYLLNTSWCHSLTQLSRGWSLTRSMIITTIRLLLSPLWVSDGFSKCRKPVGLPTLTLPTCICIISVLWIKHQTSHQNNKWFVETETSTTLTQHCVSYATTKQIIIKLVSSLSLSWYVEHILSKTHQL